MVLTVTLYLNFRAMLDSPLLTWNVGCLKGFFFFYILNIKISSFFMAHMQPPGAVDTRRETRIICYLAAVILLLVFLEGL